MHVNNAHIRLSRKAGEDVEQEWKRLNEAEWLNEALAELGEAPASDADWLNFGDGINGRSDADDQAKTIHETRDGARQGRRVRAAEPTGENETADPLVWDSPAWDAYRRRRCVQEAGIVDPLWTRGRLGLRGPIPPEDVPAVLGRAREVERRVGDEIQLEVPVIEGAHVMVGEEWTVYRGHAEDPGRLCDSEAPQPLANLALRAGRLAERVGLRQCDAVLFLLCDLVVYWPPAHATVEWFPRFSIVVRVEWPFFAPGDVAELYTRTRGSLYGLRSDATAAERRAVGMRVWSAELVHFAGERRERGETWANIYAAWEATYPDRHFTTHLSLRRTYFEANRRFPDMTLSAAPWRPKVRGKDGAS